MIRLAWNSWDEVLQKEYKKEYFTKLGKFLSKEYREQTIYPKQEDIFNALKLTPYEEVKVVIMGQDPYHGYNQAHGLAFSTLNNKRPPSLHNICKEISIDIFNTHDIQEFYSLFTGNDLTCWAKQGVLLLNTVLTVRKYLPNSHARRGWEEFTRVILKSLLHSEATIVFLLWGNNAFNNVVHSAPHPLRKNHLILHSPHPSPFSAHKGFFGNKHFSQCNKFLVENNLEPINWKIWKTE